MKTTALASALLGLGLALSLSGCAHSGSLPVASPPAPRTVAIVVTLPGGASPTPRQLSVVQETFRQKLEQEGFVVVDDPTRADAIFRVEFAPEDTEATRIDLVANGTPVRGIATPLGLRAMSTPAPIAPAYAANYPAYEPFPRYYYATPSYPYFDYIDVPISPPPPPSHHRKPPSDQPGDGPGKNPPPKDANDGHRPRPPNDDWHGRGPRPLPTSAPPQSGYSGSSYSPPASPSPSYSSSNDSSYSAPSYSPPPPPPPPPEPSFTPSEYSGNRVVQPN
jgi:hypothetical protein